MSHKYKFNSKTQNSTIPLIVDSINNKLSLKRKELRHTMILRRA